MAYLVQYWEFPDEVVHGGVALHKLKIRANSDESEKFIILWSGTLSSSDTSQKSGITIDEDDAGAAGDVKISVSDTGDQVSACGFVDAQLVVGDFTVTITGTSTV